MIPVSQTTICRLARAAVATLVLAAVAAARADGPAPFVAPAVAPAGTAAAAAVPSQPPPAAPVAPASAAEALSSFACGAPAALVRLDAPLRYTARRLATGEPLTVVAIGSSSTAGAGASSPAASYPNRLAAELKQRFPGDAITVLNRGVNGEETQDMMARFETAVIAEHPQLVLWQVGTNSVLRDHPVKPHAVLLREGIEELKATRADVVLIDPQYAPKVLDKSETPEMLDLIDVAAKAENVGVFHRFDIMRNWYEVQHIPFDGFVSPDGLHMNDWGYACWATLFGAAIAQAATIPVASAMTHSGR